LDTVIKRLYEGLFLVDSSEAASDWDGVIGTIEKMLARADADVVSIKKWDERRLAYEVNGKERGTYILTYFNGDPAKITGIERDVQLSERITRVMILRTDIMDQEDIDKNTPLERVEKSAAAEAEAAAARVAAAEAAEAAKAAEAEAASTAEIEAAIALAEADAAEIAPDDAPASEPDSAPEPEQE
jgi:small subunit ribosomal protein S6